MFLTNFIIIFVSLFGSMMDEVECPKIALLSSLSRFLALLPNPTARIGSDQVQIKIFSFLFCFILITFVLLLFFV